MNAGDQNHLNARTATHLAQRMGPNDLLQHVESFRTSTRAIEAIRDQLVQFINMIGNRSKTWPTFQDLWDDFATFNRGQLRIAAPRHCNRCYGTRRDQRTGGTRRCAACNGGNPLVVGLRSKKQRR